MTADRVYRRALGEHAAREELLAGSGEQFDAEVVDALLAALDREGAARQPGALSQLARSSASARSDVEVAAHGP